MFLLFLDFVKRLAIDTECRGRPRLEALDAYFNTAGIAEAVTVGVYTVDGAVDLLDQ